MKTLTALTALVAAASLSACSQTTEADAANETTAATAEVPVEVPSEAPTGTIVELAQGNPDLSTLVTAVTAADLGGTLSGAGPFTVFAPTNAAFDAVPKAARDELMSPAGKEDLSNILTYHVVSGETMSPALVTAIQGAGAAGYKLTTVNGASLTATLDGDTVVLTDAAGNKARVTQTDVDASNGVVHVIDKVLMPE